MPKLDQDEVRFWIKEIESCETRQRQELMQKNHYPFLIKYYEGDMIPLAKRHQSKYVKMAFINEYFPNTNQLINEIAYQYPEFMAEPTKPQASDGAPIMKGAITYGMKKLDAITEMKLGVFDMLYAGYCAIEINHIKSSKTDTYIAPKLGRKFQGIISKIKQAVGIEKAEMKMEQEGEAKEMAYASSDETYLRRWNPLDVLFDYRAERAKDLKYIIKRNRFTYAEFVAAYPNFEGKVTAEEQLPFSAHTLAENKNTVTLYEIQLKKADNKCVTFIISFFQLYFIKSHSIFVYSR